uniref:Putative MYB transcription factor n=1 Tax=Davidia involucrata TaxID=16924 RepID=A0A5B6ZER2_DAVIN
MDGGGAQAFLIRVAEGREGDWRGISRNFVKTRTPTQVASHAQKYFLRRNNHNRRRRRSSLFDITTTDTYMGSVMEEDEAHKEPHDLSNNIGGFPILAFPVPLSPVVLPVTEKSSIESLTLGQNNNQMKNSPKLIRPIPILPVPPSSKMADLNLNATATVDPSLPLSLKLTAPPSSSDQQSPPARHASAFQAMSGSFNNTSSGDSIISVA